jgi:hypothetical protein
MCTTHMQHAVTQGECSCFSCSMLRTPTSRNGQWPCLCCLSIFTLHSALALALALTLALALASFCNLHLAYHKLKVNFEPTCAYTAKAKMLHIRLMDTPATMAGPCFSPAVFHCGLQPLMLRWGSHLTFSVLVRWPLAMYAQV